VARELAKMNPNYQPALGPWRERNRKRKEKLYRAEVKIENGKVEML
jgi:hypothetical protein